MSSLLAKEENMDGAEVVRVLRACGIAPTRYSGRGMYGKVCVGFAVDDGDNLLGIVAEAVASAVDDAERSVLVEYFNACSTDQLWLVEIVYAKRCAWPEGAAEGMGL
jgi:hypothetical protein